MTFGQNQLLPIGAMARILKVSTKWLRAEAEAGHLPHVMAGEQILFEPDAVVKILVSRARGKKWISQKGGDHDNP